MRRAYVLLLGVACGSCAPPEPVRIAPEAITVLASETYIFALRPAMADPSQVEFLWAREHRDPEPLPTSLEGRTMDAAILPADDYGPLLILARDSWPSLLLSVANLPLSDCNSNKEFMPPCRIQRGENQWNLVNN